MTSAPLERIPWRVWRLALVIVIGAFLSMLDASLVNVGLDTIGTDLGAPLDLAQWVATGYLIALAVSLPLCGWLGRRVGVGRLWLGSLAAFTVASGLCALAPDVTWLIGLRVLQGLAAGLLVPAGQTILGQAVGPQRLGRVMSILGIAVSSGPALGPTAGGLILHNLPWQWLFLVNLPIGAVGLLLGLRLVPRGELGAAAPLDWPGFVLIGLGLPLTVSALTSWGEHGSIATPAVLLPLVLGVAGLLAFGLRSRRHPHPLLDLGLFRNRVYLAASGATVFNGAGQFGAMLLFPLYFQLSQGMDVISTGLSLISLGLGTAVVLPLGGQLTDRFGGGVVAFWGGVLTIATTVPFALLPTDTDALVVQALLLARGMALALAATPITTAAYASVRPDQLPDAATQVNIAIRVGGAVGGALFAVVLAQHLPSGTETAFHTAFWWLTGASVIGLACTLWLWLVQRRPAPAPSPRVREGV